MSSSSAAVEALGTIGGVSIALSLVPQVWKTFKTKSAGDISYAYQAIYIFGCTLVNIYAVTLNLWPVYVPCLIEESLIVTLTVMKFVYSKSDIPTDLSPNKTTALASDSTGKRNDETERVDVERSMKADNIENEEKV